MTLNDLKLLREHAYINGQWLEADDHARFSVSNPANGEIIATVSSLGQAETSRAIDAAHAALPAWRDKTAKERSAILRPPRGATAARFCVLLGARAQRANPRIPALWLETTTAACRALHRPVPGLALGGRGARRAPRASRPRRP